VYNNRAITEPKWKRWVVETTGPIFTPKLCQEIIDLGKTLPQEKATVFESKSPDKDLARKSTVSWIPFDKMQPMYDDINNFIQKTNRNHFGFSDIQIREQAQITEYTKGNFYNWHTDTSLDMSVEPAVRKLSMTLLLNDPSEFEGGELQIANISHSQKLMKQGHATIFASFLQHTVTPITRGVRRSLVMWFGGEPFK
jgi:PKHD-type hydroxylase